MMDTLEIDRVLAKVPGFLGAHAFNELPAKPSGDYSIVGQETFLSIELKCTSSAL